MIHKDDQRWMELCQLAAQEQDPKKLTELFAEINRILAAQAQERRLNGNVTSDGKTC